MALLLCYHCIHKKFMFSRYGNRERRKRHVQTHPVFPAGSGDAGLLPAAEGFGRGDGEHPERKRNHHGGHQFLRQPAGKYAGRGPVCRPARGKRLGGAPKRDQRSADRRHHGLRGILYRAARQAGCRHLHRGRRQNAGLRRHGGQPGGNSG